MKTYDRLFGAGPRGALLSIALLCLAWQLETRLDLPTLIESSDLRLSVIVLLVISGLGLIGWKLRALPPGERGRELVSSGPFRFIRHPLYAAFVVCLNPAFALVLNNWVYLVWAVLLYPAWSLNVIREEKLMLNEFGDAYAEYCRRSGRFLPRVF